MHYKASDAAHNTISIDHLTGRGRFHLPIAHFMDLATGLSLHWSLDAA